MDRFTLRDGRASEGRSYLDPGPCLDECSALVEVELERRRPRLDGVKVEREDCRSAA